MTRDLGAVATAAALTSVTAVILFAALRLQATAATVPLVVAVPTLVMLLEQLVRAMRRHEPEPAAVADASIQRERSTAQRERVTLFWMLLLLAMFWALGVIVALPLYLLLHLRLRSREHWTVALMVAGVTWCILIAGLMWLLDVQPPPGAIWTWLSRS